MIIATVFLFFVLQLQAQNTRRMASYIVSFPQYVEWPKEYQEGNFMIGIYGESENAAELEKLVFGRKINNQAVIIKIFKHPDEITRCHMVIISAQTSDAVETIVEKFKPYNTLIITEKSGLTKKGPGISLISTSGRLSFELNKTNIINKGLNIDNEFHLMALVTY